MNWHKLRKNIEQFISPNLSDDVQYLPAGYRYVKDKKNLCYMTLNNEEVFNKSKNFVKWYDHEQEIINDEDVVVYISEDLIKATRTKVGDKVPVDRLETIARKDLKSSVAKNIMAAQNQLVKNDFQETVNTYLSQPLNDSLKGDDILLNILALIDRRLGKKKLSSLKMTMSIKHPLVRYFYEMRIHK